MNTRTETPIPAAPRHHRVPRRTIRVFLAEDSPMLVAILARMVSLDKRVFIVGTAVHGRKALCSIRSVQPDLVITDLHLPGLDGVEATRLLKQRQNPPIIFIVTSDDTREARSRSLAAGADGFLVKSPDLAPELLSTIQEFFPDEPEFENREPKHVCESITTVE